MPRKPTRGGYIWNQQIATARSAIRKQRRVLTEIVEQGPTQAELYQMLVAVTLLAGQVDDVLEGLDRDFRDG